MHTLYKTIQQDTQNNHKHYCNTNSAGLDIAKLGNLLPT